LINDKVHHPGVNRAVLALSTARMADALGNSIYFIVIPLYVVDVVDHAIPLPDSVLVGILVSWFGLINTLMQPFMAALADRVGRLKQLIQIGLAIMALSSLSFILAQRFEHLLVIRSLQGLALATTIPASMALMATITVKETRGASMGVYSTMRNVGFGIGPLISGFLYVNYGFESVFIVGALFIVLSMGIVHVWVDGVEATSPRQRGGEFRIVDRSLLTRGLLTLGLATFVMSCNFSMMTTLENEFNARLNQTALGFGIAFSALTLGRMLTQIPLGALSDRVGRKPLIVLGLLLSAPATVVLGYVTSTFQLTVARLVQGVATAGVSAPSFALAGDLSRKGGEGRQMSVITMAFGLGMAVGPLLAGVLAVYAFELTFIIGGVLAVLGGWLVQRDVPETVHRQPSK
jgi:MFS family permease